MGTPVSGKSVAVVGSGITGLGAAYILQRNGAHVTLFEKEAKCGGHTLTDTTTEWPVDLGFQVYNLTTYPNLVGMLEELGVESETSSMSFSLSIDGGQHEWSSESLFAQRSNLLSPSFYGMVRDVLRFGREAPKVLEDADAHKYEHMTLGQYLDDNGYCTAFRNNYLLPMCAAVWSVPSAVVLKFPLRTLVRFWVNHHLLDIFSRPVWRVVKDRSRSYVNAVLATLKDVRTSTAVKSVTRSSASQGVSSGGVTVVTEDGKRERFDAATADEKAVLKAIPYNANDIWLHTDPSLMPKRKACWTSWNFLGKSGENDTDSVCVTYWLNLLQNLPPEAPDMFVTLNPIHEPAPETVIRRMSLDHPVFSEGSVAAQHRLPSIQGTGGVFLCGAWAGYGFHEDGLKAAMSVVCDSMGCKIPWNQISTSPKISFTQKTLFGFVDSFLRQMIKRGQLKMVLPDGTERVYGPGVKATDLPEKDDEWWGRPRPECTLRVINMDFAWKLITRHDTGLGEAWMDGDIVCKDPGALMAVIVANAREAESSRGALGLLNWVGEQILVWAHRARHNSEENARKNIEEHYDAGNEMYKTFLDETMTYSCGIHAPGRSLRDAQLAKIDALIDRAGIQRGDRVLEIGCGWGAFAMRAVQRTGCTVVGLTLSKEQLSEANERIKEAGLDASIELLFCDYRNCPGEGTFDRVVSCEMIEAVGHEYLESYFVCIGRMLKPGGKACIQAITCPDERYDNYTRSSDFIREHIFPGGHLPSIGAMVEAARGTGLTLADTVDIGPHYAVTLREWRRRWELRREHILKIGYSERFWRKYQFYFAYCEAAFDARYIHDYHLVWRKGEANSQVEAQSAMQPALTTGHKDQDSDLLTSALAAIWFFLAGMATSRVPLLAVVPASSAAFLVLLRVIATLQSALFPTSMKLLTRVERSRAATDMLRLLYSTGMTVAAGWFTVTNFWATTDPTYNGGVLPMILVCVAAGHLAFKLWFEVSRSLVIRRIPVLLLRATLLSVFTVAAYTQTNTAMLATTLVAEGAVVPAVIRRMLDRSNKAWGLTKTLTSVTEIVAILTLQLALHLWIGRAMHLNLDAFRFSSLGKAGLGTLAVTGVFGASRVLMLLAGH